MPYVRPTILRRRANYTSERSSGYRSTSTFYRYMRKPRNCYNAPWTSTTRTCGDADRKYAMQIAETLDAAAAAQASAENLMQTVQDLNTISACISRKRDSDDV